MTAPKPPKTPHPKQVDDDEAELNEVLRERYKRLRGSKEGTPVVTNNEGQPLTLVDLEAVSIKS